MKKIVFISALLLFSQTVFSKKYKSNWESINSRPTPSWFEDIKFGIFIHWGVYSVPAWAPANEDIGVYAKYAEWYWWRINEDSKAGKMFRDYHNKMYGENFKYQDFAGDFKAQHWNPAQWADIVKRSGAKYVVLTSKHHEGFTLWPSAQSWNWNSVDVGPHRDICGDLSKAVKDAGLHMGFYYSLYEWYNPTYKNNLEKYVDEHMIPQLKDLVSTYKPDLLWTDGEWDHPSNKWKSTEFLTWLFNESPVKDNICINDRWGKETRGKLGGYFTTEYGHVYGDVENINAVKHPWEECRGIGTSFGYNQVEDVNNYLSSKACIDLLIEKVAGGGNLLLDIGPTADGRIPVIQQQRLLDIGAWLDINGEAIYGTRKWEGSENNKLENIFFTKKGKDLYVHCTKFPSSEILIKGIKKASKVTLLGVAGNVKYKKSGKTIKITPPQISPETNPSKYAWVFKIEQALK